MSLTWDEAVAFATNEAIHGYDCRGYEIESPHPDEDEFIKTFMNFYNEITATHRISIYPVDPPGSRRMAKGRAASIWEDAFPLE